MLISTHVLVGTALGRALACTPARGPATLLAGAALGVASHFACDALPHWGLGRQVGRRDRAFLRVAVPDGLAGLGLLAAAVVTTPRLDRPLVAAVALGACLPDSDKVGEFAVGRSPWPRAVDDWHGRIQRESPDRLAGDVTITSLLALLLLGRSGVRRPRPARGA